MWDDVDPARHPFDGAAAARVVRSLGPARCVPARPDVSVIDPAMNIWSSQVADVWSAAMSQALADRFGPWAVGWRWALGEGDFDGGSVGNWCCARVSFASPDETLTADREPSPAGGAGGRG